MPKFSEVVQSEKLNDIEARAFENYCESASDIKKGFGGEFNVPANVLVAHMKFFRAHINEYLSPADKDLYEKMQKEEENFENLIANMPITSGYSFEGYRIIRYGGYVSGDEGAEIKTQLDIFSGANTYTFDDINEAIKKPRIKAIKEMKEAAAELGCNAVIGLDFDYITVGSANTTIVLTANGTAVEIEKL